MKPKYLQILAIIFLSFISTPANAQNDLNYITIRGEVRDSETKKTLEFVSVSVEKTNIATVTNTDGVFSIKIKKSLQTKALVFSHVGYESQRLSAGNSDLSNIKVSLLPAIYSLDAASIGAEALPIVKKAIERIANNYSSNVNMLTGFYRETIKKRSNYINISEAIVHTYKTPYGKENNNDRVQVYKSRQLLSPKTSDTLMVKVQGGPVMSIYMDAVKEWDLLTDPETLTYYKFTIAGSTMIDGRSHYVINFKPQTIVSYALLNGQLYIDEQTYTISRVVATLEMSDQSKATEAMLRKKPFGMRFKPEGLLYEITYKRHGDISYLSYVRAELQFKCDWKRRLFASSYLVVSEMVVTDVKEQDVAKISAKSTFNERYSLFDRVSHFYDENFWGDYNIIEPTESLESAVNRLRKKIE